MLVLIACARAHAYPLLPARPVGSAIAGPTDPHVAAVFYNPAALGPLRGVHVWAEGGARLRLGSIDRDPLEGRAVGSTSFTHADFDSFVGGSWDLSTDSFTIGMAVMTPFTDLTRYAPDAPVRYRATEHTSIVLQEALAAAFKVSNQFFVGASANFSEIWLQHRYHRDAAIYGGSAGVDQPSTLCNGQPCGLENPLAAQQLRLRGFGWGIGFSVGVLVRPVNRLWIGLSYLSHVFNTGRGGDNPLSDDTRARITPAPGQGPVCGNPNTCWAGNLITMAVPGIIMLAVRIELSPSAELEAQGRWVNYGKRQRLDVSVQGGNAFAVADSRATQVGPQFLLDRGLQDAFMVGASARFKKGEKLRLSPSLFFETSAIDAAVVDAAAMDAPKLDFALTLEWQPIRRLRIGAHVGGTAFILSRAGQGFQPRARVACVDADYALDACQAVNAGRGDSAASGKYTLFTLHMGAALGFDY